MARLQSALQFTGPLGALSAYKVSGSDQIILRTKGGPTRHQLRHHAAFASVLRNNVEFGGRAKASRWVIQMLGPQKSLADMRLSGRVNALLKPIQELDQHSRWGERHILLSRQPQLLTGFSLKHEASLDAVIRPAVVSSLSRAHLRASVEIPPLLPGINFFPAQAPLYCVQVVLGVVPDLFFQQGKYEPASADYTKWSFVAVATPWHPVPDRSDATTLEVALPHLPPDNHFSAMLSIGICYGTARHNGVVERVPFAGCAKVLAMA